MTLLFFFISFFIRDVREVKIKKKLSYGFNSFSVSVTHSFHLPIFHYLISSDVRSLWVEIDLDCCRSIILFLPPVNGDPENNMLFSRETVVPICLRTICLTKEKLLGLFKNNWWSLSHKWWDVPSPFLAVNEFFPNSDPWSVNVEPLCFIFYS